MAYKIYVLNNQIELRPKLTDDDIFPDTYPIVFELSFVSEIKASNVYDQIEGELREGYSMALFYNQGDKSLNLRQTEKPKAIETRNDFEDYLKIERARFVREVKEQNWNANLRVTAEDLLIAYDQMFNEIRKKQEV